MRAYARRFAGLLFVSLGLCQVAAAQETSPSDDLSPVDSGASTFVLDADCCVDDCDCADCFWTRPTLPATGGAAGPVYRNPELPSLADRRISPSGSTVASTRPSHHHLAREAHSNTPVVVNTI